MLEKNHIFYIMVTCIERFFVHFVRNNIAFVAKFLIHGLAYDKFNCKAFEGLK